MVIVAQRGGEDASSSSESSFWSNHSYAMVVLSSLLTCPLSKEALVSVTSLPLPPSPPAATMATTTTTTTAATTEAIAIVDEEISYTFLKVAARHMSIILSETIVNSLDWNRVNEQIQLLAQMVGRVAVWCQPRSNISKSGILAAFVKLYDHSISHVSIEFIQCALLAGHYRFAARILGNDWPLPNKSNYSLESILRYYYLRGLVYTGCHDWYMALRCFGTVLMVPTDTIISQIVMDAWTKWVILRCLVWSDPILSESSSPSLADLPPGGSFAFGRYCSSRMDHKRFKPYYRIAKSCDNLPLMRQIFAEHSNIWELDGTTGLIQHLVMELEFRAIHHLASIYSNLPLSLMAKHLQVSEEETRQILCQVPNVQFDIKDGIVTLTSTNDDSETATNDLLRLTHRLRQVDTTFTKSSRYQSYLAEKAKMPRSSSREGF